MPETTRNRRRVRHFTREQIAQLPPMLDVTTAAQLLGVGRSTAYKLAAANDLPVPVVTVGNKLRIPSAPLLALLGLTPDPSAEADDPRGGAGGAVPDAAAPGGRTVAPGRDASPYGFPGPGPASVDGQTRTR